MTKQISAWLYTTMITLAAVSLPAIARCECLEYKIIEHADSVEAVCVGEPPTEAELKAKKAEEAKERQQAEKERAAAMKEAARTTEQMKAKDAIKDTPRAAERDKSVAEARKERKRRRTVNTIEELE